MVAKKRIDAILLNSTAKVQVFAKECFFLQKTITPGPQNSLFLPP
jgi:hypothetical protein